LPTLSGYASDAGPTRFGKTPPIHCHSGTEFAQGWTQTIQELANLAQESLISVQIFQPSQEFWLCTGVKGRHILTFTIVK
jgi:hypothetical protein